MRITKKTEKAFVALGQRFLPATTPDSFYTKQLETVKKIKQIKSLSVRKGDTSRPTIEIETNNIYIRHMETGFYHKLGKFWVEINFKYRYDGISIINKSVRGGLTHHPHIHDSGDDGTQICWGCIGRKSVERLLDQYIKKFQIDMLLTFIICFLESYKKEHEGYLHRFVSVRRD